MFQFYIQNYSISIADTKEFVDTFWSNIFCIYYKVIFFILVLKRKNVSDVKKVDDFFWILQQVAYMIQNLCIHTNSDPKKFGNHSVWHGM